MTLGYKSGADSDGKRIVTCRVCGYTRRTHWPIEQIRHQCAARPSGGPGTEIHRLLTSLGVTPTSSCGCASLAAEWDRNGVEWCREHRDDVLVPRLLEAYRETDWSTVFAAAARGATHLWLVKRLNPLHPIRSGLTAVVDEAIERAARN